jgi:hypothetical protein
MHSLPVHQIEARPGHSNICGAFVVEGVIKLTKQTFLRILSSKNTLSQTKSRKSDRVVNRNFLEDETN